MDPHTYQYICMECGQNIDPSKLTQTPGTKRVTIRVTNKTNRERSKTEFNKDNGAFWNGQSIKSMATPHIKNTIMFLERRYSTEYAGRRWSEINRFFPVYSYLCQELNRR